MHHHAVILLAAREGDGLTHIACVRDPAARLALLQTYGVEIARSETFGPSQHAEAIAQALKRRFQPAALEAGGPWFAIEYPQARAALAEYDLATGLRSRMGRVPVGARVRVAGFGAGAVTGFSACGRVAVAIHRLTHVAIEVLAPASQVEALS